VTVRQIPIRPHKPAPAAVAPPPAPTPPVAPRGPRNGWWLGLLLGAFVLVLLAAMTAALAPTLGPALPVAASVVAVLAFAGGVRGLLGALASPPPAAPVAPVAPQTSTVAFDAPGATALAELKRELERYKEAERQLTAAKQEAEAAMMAKGEFLATMSHEIRTPLNGIIPLLDILLSTPLAADQRDYLVTAYQSAKQLLSIVDDILDYSKIEANKLELETVGINIKEIVDSVTRLMARNAEGKGLKFAAVIDPNVRLAMRGDPVRLRQVLTNLVSNAIKFTERGQIAIEVKKRSELRTSSELLFSVRDTGVGIPPDVQAKLFKPFTQADASTTRVHGGTGLGLVICKRIVDLMGGQIGVRSEEGKGSTFWFSVPLLKAIGDVAPLRTDVHGSRAMIVTTDQALLRRVSGFFSTWGVSYVQTSVSAEALAKLRSAGAMGDTWAFDFLVLDWGAMKNSALSLARNVLREAPLERVRIVAISGDDDLPTEFRGTTRVAVFGRTFSDVDLRAGMQRLLEAAEGGAAATVESLLPPAIAPPPAASPAATPAAAASSSQALPAPSAPAATPAPGGIGGHVLLVEDNAVNRQVAQRLLSLVGVSFEIAENGKEALDRLEQAPFDAVLMDCQMPILDGYGATRAVRRLESDGARKGHIPIVAMTANAMAGDREKCLAAGMDDYMSKPLNRALLEQMLRKWLPKNATSRGGPAPTPASAPSPTAAATAPRAATEATAQPQPPAVSAPAQPTPGVRAPAAYAAAAAGGKPPIDQEIIQDLLEMMGNEFTDLVRVYLEDTPKSLAQLEQAAQSGDVEGLIAPAHSLKSTSANLGALALSEMAKRIEHGARTRQLAAEPVLLVAEVGSEFRRVTAELKRLLAMSSV
jgi:signal transduction histidine kinase/CheY-like chemotaxis protein/HPt (histidine-containing phosphotransfer) domain-containing protein